MKPGLTLLFLVLLSSVCDSNAAVVASGETAAVRQKLAQAILSEGQEHHTLLSELADSGSTAASEVLPAWAREGVELYSWREAPKVPILFEEGEDANGKRRR